GGGSRERKTTVGKSPAPVVLHGLSASRRSLSISIASDARRHAATGPRTGPRHACRATRRAKAMGPCRLYPRHVATAKSPRSQAMEFALNRPFGLMTPTGHRGSRFLLGSTRDDMSKLLFVGIGGFLGSAARYAIGGWIVRLKGAATFPWETLVINVA